MKIGVKSLALKLGKKSLFWVACFYAAALLLLGFAGLPAGLGKDYAALLFLPALYAGWFVLGWVPDDPVNCLDRFKRNRDFGLLVLAVIFIGKLI